MNLAKLGTDASGWIIPVDRIQSDWVCYCAGAGEDISFDLALIERFGCQVHTFDPTPRAIAHARSLAEHAAAGPPMPINNRADAFYSVEPAKVASHLRFLPYGIYGESGPQRFYEPSDPSHVSHSTANLQGTSRYFVAECKTIGDIMRELGHIRLDLLKLDIEGAEHSVISNLIEEGIRPRVLCVEFDAASQQGQFAWALRDLKRLVAFGYDIACLERWNVTLTERRRGIASVQTRMLLAKLWLRVMRQRLRSSGKAA